ncbi:MAG: O-antigen ligase family protein, partial [Candidatus Andersenbacteria bacterium]|nr:O-antigen ligase family protein [Candidatus Andersenbacteria bacterium]
AGEIIKDNSLFGIGPGTFQETYLSYAEKFDEQYLEWAVPQPHNIFLAFYLQTGLIGFIGFVLILIWFFKRMNGAVPHSYNIINVLMIYILIHGLVDTTYWKNDLSLMFWLLIGMAIVGNLALDKNQKV